MGLLDGLYAPAFSDLLRGAGSLLVIGFCAAIVNGYQVRKTYKDLQNQGTVSALVITPAAYP